MKTPYLLRPTRHIVSILSLLLTTQILGLAEDAHKLGTAGNLAKNPSFEEADKSWKLPKNTDIRRTEVVNNESRSGKSSLYYINNDPDRYTSLFSQKIDVTPGQRLKFSSWVKARRLKGGKGALICIESKDAKGNFISGQYSHAYAGSYNWRKIERECVIPQNAATTSFKLFLHGRTVGEAWFDDVEVSELPAIAFDPVLQFPNYRGFIKQDDKRPWKFHIKVTEQKHWKKEPVKIETSLVSLDGEQIFNHKNNAEIIENEIELSLPVLENLPVGNYSLKQTITDPNGKTASVTSHPINVVKVLPKVHIDAENFTVVDGERFFPMGLYLHEAENEDMKRISNGGFNTILSYDYGSTKGYQQYLDKAHEHGLKVIYSLPGRGTRGDKALESASRYLNELKSSPALLAWYTNDELGTQWIPELEALYDRIERHDPDHPAFQVLDRVRDMEEYSEAADIFGADPYPVGSDNLTKTSTNTRITIAASRGAKATWIVPQLMDWSVYRPKRESHQPSLDEMRNQAYQAIINGATGLIWYSYYDMMYEKHPRNDENKNMDLFKERWADASSMAKEINSLTPALLHGEKLSLGLPSDSQIQASAMQHNNEILLMLANPYYKEKSVVMTLPDGWKVKQPKQGKISSHTTDGKTTFTLPSIASGAFRLVSE